jgi:hypothetical protein
VARLTCTGNANCSGRLTLTASETFVTRGRRHRRTVTIGVTRFSIAHGSTVSVQIALNGAGRKLLAGKHGRLAAHLAIVRLAPSPAHTQTSAVELLAGKRSRRAG